jgi:hypothetical protein
MLRRLLLYVVLLSACRELLDQINLVSQNVKASSIFVDRGRRFPFIDDVFLHISNGGGGQCNSNHQGAIECSTMHPALYPRQMLCKQWSNDTGV